MFRSLFILLQIMFPRFNWLIDITISPIAVVDKFFLHNKRLVLQLLVSLFSDSVNSISIALLM